MPTVGLLIFLCLEGETPPELALPPLRTARSTFESVKVTFSRFSEANDFAMFCSDLTQLPTSPTLDAPEAIRVVYVMGHAWKENSAYRVAALENGQSKVMSGSELLDRLGAFLAGPSLLFIDTCNAAALLTDVETRPFPRLCCITASEDEQTATEFGVDRTTRFALALAEVLESHREEEIDVLQLIVDLKKLLGRPSLIPFQTVETWTSGRPLRLSVAHGRPVLPWRRSTRTYLYLRALLIVAGVLLSSAAIALLAYYRDHIQVEISTDSLDAISGNIVLEIHEQLPDTNGDKLLFEHELIRNGTTRLRVPAANLLVVIKATNRDAMPREIRFPIFTKPSLSLKAKSYSFRLPSNQDIQGHPNMAYVPKISWLQGADRVPAINEQEFWIDLEPVTAQEYLPIADQFVRDGKLERFTSVLLTERDRRRAVEATNLKQLPKLIGQLQSVFDVIGAEERATHQPNPQDTTALPEMPSFCPRCPARMTMEEAKLYCASQNKALPTDLEWELASRGVDGRLYPWGNTFDPSRANVAGLPEKGETLKLVAVDFYPNGRSPFGLLDTVGNAGDWVDSRGGYERTFMGGTYRFNKEEALTYSAMPDTGDPLPLLPVTARCVSHKSD